MKKEEEVKDEPVFMERPKIEKTDADDDEGGIFRLVFYAWNFNIFSPLYNCDFSWD